MESTAVPSSYCYRKGTGASGPVASGLWHLVCRTRSDKVEREGEVLVLKPA